MRESELRITRAGESLDTGPTAFRVLVCLLVQAGHLVAKEDLIASVWGDTAVTDNSLTRAIAVLRKALDDDPHNPRFIETVSTAGYRFISPVEISEEAAAPILESARRQVLHGAAAAVLECPPAVAVDMEPAPSVAPHRAPARLRLPSRRVLIACGGSLLALVALYALLRRPLPAPRIADPVALTVDGHEKAAAAANGNALFLNLWEEHAIARVPTSGGELARIPVQLPGFSALHDDDPPGHAPWLLDVSPDGANYLVVNRADARVPEIWVTDGADSNAHYVANGSAGVWAPGGKDVLYATARGEIYLVPGIGGDQRPVASLQFGDFNYAPVQGLQFSPDGKAIRFTRGSQIWEMSSSGSNLHQLLPDWRRASWKCCGRWTPDGQLYVFLSGETAIKPTSLTPAGQVWAMDERTGRLRARLSKPVPLTHNGMVWGPPVPSRDGRSIFAAGATVQGELVRYDAQSRRFEPFLGGISAESVDLSPDGKMVAYVSFPDGMLWKANSDGSGRVRLTGPPWYPRQIHWSADGTRILFTDFSPSGLESAFLVPASGGSPVRLLPQAEGAQLDANWSPDGRKVVFSSSSDLQIGRSFEHEIRIVDLSTQNITSIPQSAGMCAPRWSPDGRYIAALSFSGEELKLFDLQENRWVTLATERFPQSPLWGRDSRSLYYISYSHHGVYRVLVSGGKSELVVDLHDVHHTGWYGMWLGLDGQGAPLLLRDMGHTEIYMLMLMR